MSNEFDEILSGSDESPALSNASASSRGKSSKGDGRRRWRAGHTVAASLLTISAMVFTYGASTAASTVERPQEDIPTAKQILTVADVTYLVTETGSLYSQGLNNVGQLGTGSTNNSEEWQRVTFPAAEGASQPEIEKISSYGEHVISLDANGRLWTWGSDEASALGNDRDSPALTPETLNVSYSFEKMVAGDDFVLALDDRGKLYSWGNNDEGQLGLGDRSPVEGPNLVLPGKVFSSVAAGAHTGYALDEEGYLYVWGDNSEGQFGTGNKDSSNTPQLLEGGPWQGVYPSRYADTVLAINSEGILNVWGSGEHALMGDGRDWREEQRIENQRVEDEKARILAEDEARKEQTRIDAEQAKLQELYGAWVAEHAEWQELYDKWLEKNPEPKREAYGIDEDETFPELDEGAASAAEEDDEAKTEEDELTPEERAREREREAYIEAVLNWRKERQEFLAENPEPIEPTSLTAEQFAEVRKKVDDEFEYTDTSGMKPEVIPEPEISEGSTSPKEIALHTRFTDAAVGSENAYALDVNGALWSWGSDENGQSAIGVDEKTHTHTPVYVGGFYRDLYAGPQWAVAVSDYSISTWGLNDESNRLSSNEKKLDKPTVIDASIARGPFTRVVGGDSTAYASRADNSSVVWGSNLNGVAGVKSDAENVEFMDLPGTYGEISPSAHGVNALAGESNFVFYWGSDEDRLSTGEKINGSLNEPKRQYVDGFIDVAATRLGTTVVDRNGFVWSWGMAWMGNLDANVTEFNHPTRIPLDARVKAVVGAQSNAMLLSDTNELYWWGSGSSEFKLEKIAQPEGGLGEISSIAAGDKHFNVLTSDGEVWTYGIGKSIAIPHTVEGDTLTKVELPGTATAISSGGKSSLALVDGVLYGWGDNENRQLDPQGENYFSEPTAISSPLDGLWGKMSVSATHTLALTESGIPYVWGSSRYIEGLGAKIEAPIPAKITKEGE